MTSISPCYIEVEIESWEVLDVTAKSEQGALLKLKVKWNYKCIQRSDEVLENNDIEECPDGQSCERQSPTMESIHDVPLYAVIPNGEADGACIKCLVHCGKIKDRLKREDCLTNCVTGKDSHWGTCPDGKESVVDEDELTLVWYAALVKGEFGSFECPCLLDWMNDLLDKDYWRINNILSANFDELCKRYNSN